MVQIRLPEDCFGYGTEIFIPNVISCGAVVIKLTVGFIGFHFTAISSKVEINAAFKYAAETLVPMGGKLVSSIFFVDKADFGKDSYKTVKSSFKSFFKVDLKVVEKPNLLTTDLWVHKPTDAGGSGSWLGTRIHDKKSGVTAANANPHVLKVKPDGTIIAAPAQALPADAGSTTYQGTYMHVEV